MGLHLNLKFCLTVSGLAALFLVSAGSALPDQAQARIPAPQTYPAISLEKPLARDAETFARDRALEASCRKSGQEKDVCLCVTHIMKYELTLSEYKAATRLYGRPDKRTAIYSALKEDGFHPAEINMAEEMERSLTANQDFATRCAEAKAYYRESVR